MARKHSSVSVRSRTSGRRISEPRTTKRGVVFVAMAFSGTDMSEAYTAIKDECSRLGLDAYRVDELTGSDFVILNIFGLIEHAEFIIFDLTHERLNVVYELGYADGVGVDSKNILLLAREGTILPFDVASRSVQFYSSTEHLRSLVARHMKGMLGDAYRVSWP